jgi:hypothetical protein
VAAPRTRDIFIYRVSKTVSAIDMSTFLKDSGVSAQALEIVSKDCARNRSFRVTVPFDQLDLVFDPTIWPSGVGVRYYVKRDAKRASS